MFSNALREFWAILDFFILGKFSIYLALLESFSWPVEKCLRMSNPVSSNVMQTNICKLLGMCQCMYSSRTFYRVSPFQFIFMCII